MCAKSLQLCPTLCDPMNCSPPGFFVHGILQARILEWVVMPSSRRSSQPRDRSSVSSFLSWQEGSLPLTLPGKTKVNRCLVLKHSRILPHNFQFHLAYFFYFELLYCYCYFQCCIFIFFNLSYSLIK